MCQCSSNNDQRASLSVSVSNAVYPPGLLALAACRSFKDPQRSFKSLSRKKKNRATKWGTDGKGSTDLLGGNVRHVDSCVRKSCPFFKKTIKIYRRATFLFEMWGLKQELADSWAGRPRSALQATAQWANELGLRGLLCFLLQEHVPFCTHLPLTVNETHSVSNLSKCVIYGTQGPFENAVSSLFFLWVCSLEEFQSKDALNTIWKLLSLHLPDMLFQHHRRF